MEGLVSMSSLYWFGLVQIKKILDWWSISFGDFEQIDLLANNDADKTQIWEKYQRKFKKFCFRSFL